MIQHIAKQNALKPVVIKDISVCLFVCDLANKVNPKRFIH